MKKPHTSSWHWGLWLAMMAFCAALTMALSACGGGGGDSGGDNGGGTNPPAANTAPAFTAQPKSLTVNEGDPASMTVAVGGDPAPTLQWQYSKDGGKTWANFPNATGTTLNSPKVLLSDNGWQIRVVATNSAGSATSQVATLTVTATGGGGTPTNYPVYSTATSSNYAGTFNSGYVNSADPHQASFAFFGGLVGDANGNLYVGDSTPAGPASIRLVASSRAVSTYAGALPPGKYGYADSSNALQALFTDPHSVARASDGTLYVTDNYCIRKIAPGANASTAGAVSTVAGMCGTFGVFYPGPAKAVKLENGSLALDANGSLYVAENNDVIRQIRPDGKGGVVVSTLAGALPTDGFRSAPSGDNTGTGPKAQFRWPDNLWLDGKGNLFLTVNDGTYYIQRLVLQP